MKVVSESQEAYGTGYTGTDSHGAFLDLVSLNAHLNVKYLLMLSALGSIKKCCVNPLGFFFPIRCTPDGLVVCNI